MMNKNYKQHYKEKGYIIVLSLLLSLAMVGCGKKSNDDDQGKKPISLEEAAAVEQPEEKVFRDEKIDNKSGGIEDNWEDKGDDYYEELYSRYFDTFWNQFPKGIIINTTITDKDINQSHTKMVAMCDNEFYFKTFYKDDNMRYIDITIYQNASGRVFINDGNSWKYSSNEDYMNVVDTSSMNLFQINIVDSAWLDQKTRGGLVYDVVNCHDEHGRQYLAYINHRTEGLEYLIYKDGLQDIEMQFQSVKNMPSIKVKNAQEINDRNIQNNKAFQLILGFKEDGNAYFEAPEAPESTGDDGNVLVGEDLEDAEDVEKEE